VLQITGAQQRAPIHFILPHLKLNRTEVQRTDEGRTKHDRYATQKATDPLQGYDAATTGNQKQHGAHLHDCVHPSAYHKNNTGCTPCKINKYEYKKTGRTTKKILQRLVSHYSHHQIPGTLPSLHKSPRF